MLWVRGLGSEPLIKRVCERFGRCGDALGRDVMLLLRYFNVDAERERARRFVCGL